MPRHAPWAPSRRCPRAGGGKGRSLARHTSIANRNQIERCWSRLKERRAVATRYDKTAAFYAAGVAIATSLDWIKSLTQ